MTVITPGFVHTDFVSRIADTAQCGQLEEACDRMAITPDAIAGAIAFAVEQPPEVDVGEIVIRPTAQG